MERDYRFAHFVLKEMYLLLKMHFIFSWYVLCILIYEKNTLSLIEKDIISLHKFYSIMNLIEHRFCLLYHFFVSAFEL